MQQNVTIKILHSPSITILRWFTICFHALISKQTTTCFKRRMQMMRLSTIFFLMFSRASTDWLPYPYFSWLKKTHFGAWFTSLSIWCHQSITVVTNNWLELKLIRYDFFFFQKKKGRWCGRWKKGDIKLFPFIFCIENFLCELFIADVWNEVHFWGELLYGINPLFFLPLLPTLAW